MSIKHPWLNSVVLPIALIVSLTSVALALPIGTASANSATAPVIEKTAFDYVQKYGAQQALITCLGKSGKSLGDYTYTSHIISGEFIQRDARGTIDIGYAVAPGKGSLKCRDSIEGQAIGFAQTLGWNDPMSFVCDLGATFSKYNKVASAKCGDSVGLTSSGNEALVIYDLSPILGNDANTKVRTAIKSKGGPYSLNSNQAARYLADWYAIKEVCTPSGGVPVKGETGQDAITPINPNDNVDISKKILKIVDETGKINYVRFTITKASSKTPWAFAMDADGDWQKGNGAMFNGSCDGLIKDFNNHAEAYAKYIIKKIDSGDAIEKGEGSEAGSGEEEGPSCNIDGGLGWILCPLMITMSSIVDGAMEFITSTFLEIESSLISHDNAFSAWKGFRNLANVMFVVMFLLIIFSQVSSFGISNYGIKKLLPKLIVLAIVVNTSYYISAIFVDLSNMLGYALSNLFVLTGFTPSASSGSVMTQENISAVATTGTVIALTVGAGIALWVALPSLMGGLLVGLVSLITIVLMLAARKAIVLLLVIVSPLAFASMLLPNTEFLFKKWKDLMTGMLLLFPTIGLIWGGSQLAASIIASNPDDIIMQIVALIITTAPLLATWPLLKGALSATGKLGASIDKFRAGAQKGTRAWSDGARVGKASAEWAQQRKVNRALRQAGVDPKGRTDKKGRPIMRRRASQWWNRHTGKSGSLIAASGIALADEQEQTEIKNYKAQLARENTSPDELLTTAMGSGTRAAAAAQRLLDIGETSKYNQVWDQKSKSKNPNERRLFAAASSGSEGKPLWAGGSALSDMMNGNAKGHREIIEKAINDNVYSPSTLPTRDRNEIGDVADVNFEMLNSKDANRIKYAERLQGNVKEMDTDSRFSGLVGKNRQALDSLRDGEKAKRRGDTVLTHGES